MSLTSEIQTLRAQIEDRARKVPAAPLLSGEPPAGDASGRRDVDAFLKMLNGTLDEFADELDKYPRLTALAALGIGLAAGVVIGRQIC